VPMLTKPRNKLRSDEPATADYYDFHDHPFISAKYAIERCRLALLSPHSDPVTNGDAISS
jgi:hypothetical protein